MDLDPFFPIISTTEAQTSKEVSAKYLERGGWNVRRREEGREEGIMKDTKGTVH